jgi:hypothetical protein
MYCSKCGANVADGTAFCSACGQPMVGFSVGQTASAAPPEPTATGGTVYAPPAQAGWQAAAARPAVAYAGFWLRVVAFIIDALVLYFVGRIVTLPFAASMGVGMRGMMTGHPPNLERLLPFIHAMIGLALLRLMLCWKAPHGRPRWAKRRWDWKSRIWMGIASASAAPPADSSPNSFRALSSASVTSWRGSPRRSKRCMIFLPARW